MTVNKKCEVKLCETINPLGSSKKIFPKEWESILKDAEPFKYPLPLNGAYQTYGNGFTLNGEILEFYQETAIVLLSQGIIISVSLCNIKITN